MLQIISDVQSVVLADFALSEQVSDRGTLRGRRGTIDYQAPEFFLSEDPEFSTAADIWAFGITLFALFTGSSYFGNKGAILEWNEWDFEDQFRADLVAAGAPAAAIEAIMSMLKFDPAKRLTAAQLGCLDYFRYMDSPLAQDTNDTVSRFPPGIDD
jgi:serine/threonine protein kinase